MGENEDEDRDETLRDEQLRSELEMLRRESEEILNGTNEEFLKELQVLDEIRAKKLQLIEDFREYQMRVAHECFLSEKQQAMDELNIEKEELREAMLLINRERRKRLDAFRGIHSKPQVKKKAKLPNADDRNSRAQVPTVFQDGTVPLQLTADEINKDIYAILTELETMYKTQYTKPIDINNNKPVQEQDVYASRGILHFFDQKFEKGQRVSLQIKNGKGSSTRVVGKITSVTTKEAQVQVQNGGIQHVYISHLRNGKSIVRKLQS